MFILLPTHVTYTLHTYRHTHTTDRHTDRQVILQTPTTDNSYFKIFRPEIRVEELGWGFVRDSYTDAGGMCLGVGRVTFGQLYDGYP